MMEAPKDIKPSPSTANRKQLLSSISGLDAVDIDALLNMEWNGPLIKGILGESTDGVPVNITPETIAALRASGSFPLTVSGNFAVPQPPNGSSASHPNASISPALLSNSGPHLPAQPATPPIPAPLHSSPPHASAPQPFPNSGMPQPFPNSPFNPAAPLRTSPMHSPPAHSLSVSPLSSSPLPTLGVLTQSGLSSSLTGSMGPLFEFSQEMKPEFAGAGKTEFTQPPHPTSMEATQVNAGLVRVIQQPESNAVLVKKHVCEYTIEISGMANEKMAQMTKVTAECWFWIDTTQKWELKDDAMDVNSLRKHEKGTLRVTFQIKFTKTSKMLPVFVRFHVNHHAQPPIHATIDTNKVILIGREDLQKTRAEGTLFWMRVAGGMENDIFKAKYPWATVETLLKQHFAKEMHYEGRMFDERELQYIKERAKMGNSDQVPRDVFLQTFWPWYYPVEQNIVKYKDLWNNGLIHGFYQTHEVEQLIKNTPPGTFILRFCSNSNFDPQGALAVTVSKGEDQVEHILLPADSLEKEPLYKLLGRYTDCVFFYPNIPKTAIEAIRKEMEEIPGVAHYKDVGFQTSSPAFPMDRSFPSCSTFAGTKRSVSVEGQEGPALKKPALDTSDLPSTVIVKLKEGTPGDVRELRFHLSDGLTFRQLMPNVMKLMKFEGVPAGFAFQDKEGVSYPDDGVINATFRGAKGAPELFIVKL